MSRVTRFLWDSGNVQCRTEEFLTGRSGSARSGNGQIWQCYDFISSTCDPWQLRVLSARFLCSPHHTFLHHHLHTPILSSPTTLSDSWRGVGFLTDQPCDVLWTISSSSSSSGSPIFTSQTHQKACAAHRFYNSHILCNQVVEVLSRVRDQGRNGCASASYFLPSI